MKIPLALLKERICDTYDVEYVIDVLGLDVADLLDAFEEQLVQRRHLFPELDSVEEDDYE